MSDDEANVCAIYIRADKFAEGRPHAVGQLFLCCL
jgi:hypothetical protein